jgi:uncharacterized protein DUF6152
LEFDMKNSSAALIALSLTVPASLSAHHTISAVYDTSKVVALKGVVTEVDWQNPHVILHLDVKNADGSTVRWDVETWHLQGMRRRGLNQNFVKAGDPVDMTVFIAKDGTQKAELESIALPTGTAYFSMVKQP